MLDQKHHVHMIGIGGSGMNALAKVLAEAGFQVSGSDLNRSKVTDALALIGIEIRIGHSAKNVDDANLVVISSAIPPTNPELEEARRRGLTVVKRAELLGELTRRQRSILIAGTHGKTTTSSMASLILERAGLDPTVLVGGEMLDLGTSAKLGRGEYLVAEADEFDATFLRLSPWTAVITNIEADHLDFYDGLNAIITAFDQFMDRVPDDGHIIACWDDELIRALAGKSVERSAKVISYGIGPGARWQAVNVQANARGGNDFDVVRDGAEFGRFSLRVPGRHNMANALAAIITSSLVGIRPTEMATVLAEFRGAARRFELKGSANGVIVYDDYAHHPTEITATLRGARERHQGRIWAIFQPHTYNRTKHFLAEFARALELADKVIVTEVYMPPGREVDTLGVSAQDIVKLMNHPDAEYIETLNEVAARVMRDVQAGDLIITMGAGDVNTVAPVILEALSGRPYVQ